MRISCGGFTLYGAWTSPYLSIAKVTWPCLRRRISVGKFALLLLSMKEMKNIRYLLMILSVSCLSSCDVFLATTLGLTDAVLSGGTTTPVPTQSYYTPSLNISDAETTSSTTSVKSSTRPKSTCGLCSGTGKVVDWTPDYTGKGKSKYCSECGKNVPYGHYHKTCSLCHGKGVS